MFIRIKTTPNSPKSAVQIVESHRTIVGARIKKTSKYLQKQILDKTNYKTINWKEQAQNNQDSISCFNYNKGRLLYVTYNTSRAEKDRHDREKAISKLKVKIARSNSPKDLISNFGYKKFIRIEGESTIAIDESKMEEAAKWDGLHGIITNSKILPPQEILKHYHGLWQIEECFRISKHDLRIRPVFHWTPKRIKAHIAICYISLVCIRHLEYRLAMQYQKLSAEVIRNELMHAQVSILKHIKTGEKYGIPSRITKHLKKIYQVVGIKISDIPFKI